ncbi:hypothetical protein [Nocardia amikacinitolerans]|uniref:hypothetical protein n=1 Tax=Nocardia amikacinitolerans TaxID=756689 RepID=UPI0020A2457B|nr:hypothetical protein [Nocardia amikacinitolerans]MCP2293295.1 hypothetical protein [Nocardia amikacinitolerans]
MHNHRPVLDPVAAPLGYPAIATAGVLIVVAAMQAPRLPLWARDYGDALVYTAFALCSALTLSLLHWGWRVRRPVTDEFLGAAGNGNESAG